MPSSKRTNFALKGFVAAGLSVLGCAVCAPQQSKAVCVSKSNDGTNNCFTFNPLANSNAIQEFTESNLAPGTSVQFGFQLATGPAPLTISNIAYQFTGQSIWNDLGTSGAVTMTTALSYLPVITSSNVSPGLKLRYTIPTGVAIGEVVHSFLLSNDNGSTDTAGVLINNFNNFTLVNRRSTAVTDVPGPLPVLGAVSAFAFSRRLRRRMKQS